MGPLPHLDGWAQRLRAARRQELAHGASGAPSAPNGDDHRISLTVVHDSVLATLAKIDAAEDAMRSVLRAWSQDPARGGAHLLGSEPEGPTSIPGSEAPTQETDDAITLNVAHTGPLELLPDTQPAQWHSGPTTTVS
jgi:hypothetical protein